ncbi:MAG TPA: hypothetical protein VIY29_09425, partial [Ktedonobacteraceae bacterium]
LSITPVVNNTVGAREEDEGKGGHSWSPICTNLRKDEFVLIKSQRLPRPWWSLRLEEIRLLTLALLPGSLLQ